MTEIQPHLPPTGFKQPEPRRTPLVIADAARSIRHVFVHDLIVDAEIGVWSHEKGKTQKVRINVDLSVDEGTHGHGDNIDNVVCYNQLVEKIHVILLSGHVSLVETLAEKIAEQSLQDKRILSSRVRVEKLEAIQGASSVGVEIERMNH